VGDIEAVKQHLAAGADVNGKSGRNATTPLHLAANNSPWNRVMGTIHDDKEIVELLIVKGADVNAKNADGGTPLHRAAWKGHKEVAELLITNGADVNAKNADGHTPLDRANANTGKIADLLRKHGGKTGEELKAEGK